MNRYNWLEIPEETLNEMLSRRVIHTSASTVAQISLKKGAVVPLHLHVNEQVTMLNAGSLAFEIDGQHLLLRPGDVLVIPPNSPHRVEALEDSSATDLFTPPREDWIRGDDTYLRRSA